MELRRWLPLAALGLVAVGLAIAVVVLVNSRSAAESELAATQQRLAERDAEIEELRSSMAAADEDAAGRRDAATVENRELQTQVEQLEEQVEQLTVQLAVQQAAAETATDRLATAARAEPAEDGAADEPGAAAVPAPTLAPPAAPEPPPSPVPDDTSNACDDLGMGHENGDAWCAQILQDIADCYDRIENDPNWVHWDGPLYEHVQTGELTSCDV
ncbi:hypothetical protein [Egicoccus halophilus]|uniref:Uncharacterized protein n=1 Tax=Egicoccus halophilus TaxID=1670830 RepID=A0A8J3AB14_9ACTN|nr:hypothetical protein [Egicoccus halophilus]GGI09419.1 hypothetical protein GCM10011354_33980 [Egicoccus halophilus]